MFNALFIEDTPPVVTPERKGRSEHLINKRNELLICRYYYHIKIVSRQYIATIKLLERETFLTERTIIDALQKNSDTLKLLAAAKPTIKYFKDKFPFYHWPEPVKD